MSQFIDVQKIKQWFDGAGGHEQRGDSSDHGFLNHAMYMPDRIRASDNATVL